MYNFRSDSYHRMKAMRIFLVCSFSAKEIKEVESISLVPFIDDRVSESCNMYLIYFFFKEVGGGQGGGFRKSWKRT